MNIARGEVNFSIIVIPKIFWGTHQCSKFRDLSGLRSFLLATALPLSVLAMGLTSADAGSDVQTGVAGTPGANGVNPGDPGGNGGDGGTCRRFGGKRRPPEFSDRHRWRGRIRRDRLRQRQRGSRRRWRPGDIRRGDLCRRCLHHSGSGREWRRGRRRRLRGRNGSRRERRGGRRGRGLELSHEHGRRRRFHGRRFRRRRREAPEARASQSGEPAALAGPLRWAR